MCENQYKQWKNNSGDGIWAAAPLWGIPWIHAILGIPMYIGYETICNDHKKISWENIFQACDLKDNQWLELLNKIVRLLSDKSRGRYPLSTIITPGITVILSEMRGLSDFLYDLIESPQLVDKAFSAITEIYLTVLDIHF